MARGTINIKYIPKYEIRNTSISQLIFNQFSFKNFFIPIILVCSLYLSTVFTGHFFVV